MTRASLRGHTSTAQVMVLSRQGTRFSRLTSLVQGHSVRKCLESTTPERLSARFKEQPVRSMAFLQSENRPALRVFEARPAHGGSGDRPLCTATNSLVIVRSKALRGCLDLLFADLKRH